MLDLLVELALVQLVLVQPTQGVLAEQEVQEMLEQQVLLVLEQLLGAQHQQTGLVKLE
jgi:hypothetical protein